MLVAVTGQMRNFCRKQLAEKNRYVRHMICI